MNNLIELKDIMKSEFELLKKLLELLEGQYISLAKNEVFKLEDYVDKINRANIKVAKAEMERRKITGNESMREIVQKFEDEELEVIYRDINKLIEELKLQKDSNELIIKQGLSFNNQMLRILNPDKTPKTYNQYGKRR